MVASQKASLPHRDPNVRAIGVLTSGGDAPGMNPAIRAVVRTALYHGIQVWGVREGFEGLIRGEMEPLSARDVGGILQRGGTMLYSARSKRFLTPEGQREAIRQMNERGIDGLAVIGGDGSMRGAYALHQQGVRVVGIPASIDNDIWGTNISIGVDTALNTILDAVDKLRDTASSHQRAFLIETMGRDCGYLALMAGIIGGAEMVLIPEVQITMEEVKMAIASFERTIISGDSPFDRYLYGGDTSAMDESAIRGLEVFVGQGRCVSCHTISETHSIFTDNRFHNLGVGFDLIDKDVKAMADEFSQARKKGQDVDIAVLENKNISELGRFAVTDHYQDMGSFRTPTLRNVAVTAPYMHDGSQDSLEEVIEFYNNGGSINEGDPVNPFQSGGIRPLNLSEQQKEDLLAFLQALTSPEYQE